jgi:hypothetical protein
MGPEQAALHALDGRLPTPDDRHMQEDGVHRWGSGNERIRRRVLWLIAGTVLAISMSGGSAVADDGGSGSATGAGSGEKTQVERRTNPAGQHLDGRCGDGAASDYGF